MRRNEDGSPADGRFELSFNSFMRLVMTPLLVGPKRCRVQLTSKRLKVKMGLGAWAFSASVRRAAVTGAARVSGPVLGWGAHGWRGRWLINGSSRGLVRVSIDPPGRGRCLFVPVTLRELTLSLDRPDEFIAAVNAS
jgi:hypothetical protein